MHVQFSVFSVIYFEVVDAFMHKKYILYTGMDMGEVNSYILQVFAAIINENPS